MKKIKFLTQTAWLIVSAFILTTATSCSDDDVTAVEEKTDDSQPEKKNKFFIAASQDAATYFLTADDLESGTTSIVGNGIEVTNSFTHLVSGTNNLITALAYRQGNPGIGVSFRVNANGNLQQVAGEFQLTSGYNTVGIFENYIVAGRTATLASGNQGASFYFVDQSTGVVSSKDFESTETLGGGTVTPTFAGILDRGDGEFFSAYTKESTNVDSVWIASFDKDFKLKRVYADDRISYSTGRWKSARYSQIANDDSGNTYVFSGGHETETTKPAGVIRIPKGATAFDSYYFNIEEKADGHHFRKVWHAGGDNFLIEFYNESGAVTTNTPATHYGIVNVTNKTVKFITGIPSKDQVTDTGWPIVHNGKVYLPLAANDGNPTVYIIDPATATAKAGLVIQAGGILGLGVFTY